MQLLFPVFSQAYFPVLLIGLVGTLLSIYLKRDERNRIERDSSIEKRAHVTLWVCAFLPVVFIATTLFILVTL